MNNPLLNQRAKLGTHFAYDDSAILPGMIENQKQSFMNFLKGLGSVFNDFFPIVNHTQTAKLEFLDYIVDEPKVSYDTCIDYSITYAVSLRVKFSLTISEAITNNGKTELVVKDVKEQWIFFADVPLMSDHSTLLINGSENVVISQMQRSPGIFFDHDGGKNYSTGKYLFSACLIPYRGSWLDFEFDIRDIIYFRIDKKRKIPAITLLRACGFSTQYILDSFYKSFSCDIASDPAEEYITLNLNSTIFLNSRLKFDLFDIKTRDLILTAGVKLDAKQFAKLAEYYDKTGNAYFYIAKDALTGLYLAQDIIVNETIVASCGEIITDEIALTCKELGIKNLNFYLIDHQLYNAYIIDTLLVDKNLTTEAALIEICRIFRGTDSNIDVSIATDIFKNIFFVPEKYDLSVVGRMKMNSKLNLNVDSNFTILNPDDFIQILKELIRVKDGLAEIDDIDHLSNRRIRSIGELIENQIKMGLTKLVKNAADKLSSAAIATSTPYDVVYTKFVSSAIREFFTLSQFSQFMDQTNPLSEITHKRRISALGVGGLNRERAGFEVRDVHYTHYGRICPIETPEGTNIGLINSLSVFAKIDQYGFIRTPYYKVVKGVITQEIVYLAASDEINKNIAEISSKIDKNKKLTGPKVSCRCYGEFVLVSPNEVDYIDVSSKQIVSVATSLIPFLDNDDANRALMGANMQRQAVPLLKPRSPIVGTGMEAVVAKDSGVMVIAKYDAVVKWVDAGTIILDYSNNVELVENFENNLEVINLKKYRRSNYNTCINQKPLVRIGESVKKGQIIADGFSTESGELALGDNILVAFLSWKGYNFEDSIVISERIIADDVFTSIHLEEFECVVRDTRLGEERITRDLPNVSEEALLKLDENGLIHIGSVVKPGDILVGKVMPKADSVVIPEEKLLRAVFGESATDVIDASLYLPPGVAGVVVDIKILSRRGIEKDYATTMNNRKLVDALLKEMNNINSILTKKYKENLLDLGRDAKIKSTSKKFSHLVGTLLSYEALNLMTSADLAEMTIDKAIGSLKTDYLLSITNLENKYAQYIKELADGYGIDLPHGVLGIFRVKIATKSKLQAGDKMSGRHGNKGVVSVVAPVEDMPYLADGTPIDIILSPLGIPSRMNMGQVLEVHLGFALFCINRQVKNLIAKKPKGWMEKVKNLLMQLYHRQPEVASSIKAMTEDELILLGKTIEDKVTRVSIPVFSGVKDEEITDLLKLSGCDDAGQSDLYDGMTGEKIHRKVTVGIMYILKLHHLVDNKIHARSIGPYSLVTQQPLGGRSHFGGQRFGEMECWALQAYGAAYTLQEMLTVKSDDVVGRVMAYDSIIKGENIKECGIPESFNVIRKELLALCINVEFIDSAGNVTGN